MRLGRLAVVAALVLASAACTKTNPDYCADASMYGNSCSKAAAAADARVETDGGDAAETGDVGDAGDASDVSDVMEAPPMCTPQSCAAATAPICDVDAGLCKACTTSDECAKRDSTNPGCDQGQCYPCATNAECTVSGQPICDTHACRACKTDSECGGPGICLDDGSCAVASQVSFVEYNLNGCPAADGTTAHPYCNPSDAVAGGVSKPVIVIWGPASGPLPFDHGVTTDVTVVGKMNSAGEAPSIPLGVSTGISVAMNHVLVRDLSIKGGTGLSATGVVVRGNLAKVTLRRVTIDTGSGTGVQDDTGASLVMDQCIVENNALVGLDVQSAFYDVANSVFSGNGLGVRLNSPMTPSLFRSSTIVNDVGSAISCYAAIAVISGSIVTGFNDSCTLDHCLTTAPTFNPVRPFHLTAPDPCPAGLGPGSFPDHDIDGDPRTVPVDCGADQFK